MARSRAYSAILEQSRLHRRTLVLTGTLLVLTAGLGLFWPRSQHQTVHAFAIPSPKGRVMVEVLNGTGRQGAARTATRMLRRQGLDVVSVGNADSLSDSTRVVVRRGDPSPARYVAQVLGAKKVLVETDTLRRVDVSVILGGDFQPRLPLHP
jgi:LytR cell envelope-related transcriptional attenuator